MPPYTFSWEICTPVTSLVGTPPFMVEFNEDTLGSYCLKFIILVNMVPIMPCDTSYYTQYCGYAIPKM